MNDGIEIHLNPDECRVYIGELQADKKKFEGKIQEFEKEIKDPHFLGLFSGTSEEYIAELREYVEHFKSLTQNGDELIRYCEERVKEFDDLLNQRGRRK